MKKYIAFLLCLITILSLVSCDFNNNQDDLSSSENGGLSDLNNNITNDDNITPSVSENERAMQAYEAVLENKIKILLVSLLSIDRTRPYICTLKPFFDGVYVKINNLYFLGTERKIINAICNINKKNISELYKHQRFYGVNPFQDLDPDDWLVAWLMSARVSQRSIAEFMNVNVKAIEKRASTIYTHLIVENYENFILLSDLYQWSKFIPPRISMSPVLNEVCLM